MNIGGNLEAIAQRYYLVLIAFKTLYMLILVCLAQIRLLYK
ncbi:hypothetical protein PN451_17215 [Dolichospermum planctonicum CS-1226]|uniref:Uncharacterized protein n=1 Tax=Dolichospermum planctonicum CS-1226 TaxID=3021751 RepID=A0ABT5AM26_9CYAN|nr:hypothetical protein [Dolichospermum planctonicum]MDB9537546.1 hypothetical protein [Dolichospermum planctonicum CS-1226]